MSLDLSAQSAVRPRISDVVGPKAIIAVVQIDDPSVASDLASVLGDAGVHGLEITLRTPGALAAIERAATRAAFPVGAGTVLDLSQAASAVSAGAQFLVSPGSEEELARATRSFTVPVVPGVLTPSEIQLALRLGFREVKLFPAELFGGLELVRALSPVFGDVSFIPTGGVDLRGAAEYLRHDQVIAVGGTWMAPTQLIASRDWAEIGRRAEAIRQLSTTLAD